MKKIIKNTIAVAIMSLSIGSAFAGATLDRIKETGTLTVGHRENAMPYGMLDNRGFPQDSQSQGVLGQGHQMRGTHGHKNTP